MYFISYASCTPDPPPSSSHSWLLIFEATFWRQGIVFLTSIDTRSTGNSIQLEACIARWRNVRLGIVWGDNYVMWQYCGTGYLTSIKKWMNNYLTTVIQFLIISGKDYMQGICFFHFRLEYSLRKPGYFGRTSMLSMLSLTCSKDVFKCS